MFASNASLWAPLESENTRGEGFLLQIDHFNPKNGVKYTRTMHCKRMPQDIKEEDEKCILLDAKV
jgi:hypothetical protein